MGEYKNEGRTSLAFSTWIVKCGRITKKMSTASFGVQKTSFMASWSMLVDNYMARKSDDKLDSLEKKTWMSQIVTTACELCCQLNLSVDEGFRM